ncbi:MAG: hypothetical protein AAGN46_03525 [Acidobacteriota bacterium]
MLRGTRFRTARLVLALLLAAAFLPAAASAAEPWIHIKVEGQQQEKININLPLSMAEAAVAMIPAEVGQDVELDLDGQTYDWYKLTTLWESVRDAPEATFVTVENADEMIFVRKEGEYMLVQSEPQSATGAEIDVKFPLSVIDALLSGPEGTLDFTAAFDALASTAPGQLVSLRDENSTVKIWIDYFEDQN